MSPKAKTSVSQLVGKVKTNWDPPEPLEGASLLEQGLLCVLTRHLTPTQAGTTIKNLREAFFDWNELRVSQAQEIVPLISSRAKNGGTLLIARDIKEYLQEVFQKNHGFDLEFLREDLGNAGKFLAELEFLGAAGGHYILWVAGGKELPVTLDLVRVLDRLGVIARTTSIKKARAAIEPLVPKGKTLEFATAFATVVDGWCDRKKPTCWECPLLDECPHGVKVEKDWRAQQERLAAQRAREEARNEALRKKEEARLAREEQRRKRDAEKRAKKLEREREKKKREDERLKAAAEKKKKAEDAAKKKAAEAAKKKAAEAKKKAAAKAAAAKKKAAKKTTKKVTKKAAKKTAKKATKKVTKKPAAKKATKKTAKKAAKKVTKKVTKKPAAKKATKKTTKKVTKKATKKTAKKAAKKTAKKATKKKR